MSNCLGSGNDCKQRESFSQDINEDAIPLDSEKLLHKSFRSAAVSVTQMYREAQKLKNQSFVDGYDKCLRDIWAYATVTIQKRDYNTSYDINGGKISVDVTELLSALSRRLANLEYARNHVNTMEKHDLKHIEAENANHKRRRYDALDVSLAENKPNLDGLHSDFSLSRRRSQMDM